LKGAACAGFGDSWLSERGENKGDEGVDVVEKVWQNRITYRKERIGRKWSGQIINLSYQSRR
ncbi:hypothetical protein, partial [Caballeronia sp. ATUFL_F2_KS9A]|uniref:hypothetical protein n=1 Tax=Caballeronia sp. ATUFL_F2_KS9A TaxID=2921777 RepID=UPI0020297A80